MPVATSKERRPNEVRERRGRKTLERPGKNKRAERASLDLHREKHRLIHTGRSQLAARAIARFVRLGPRKVGQVLDLIRGKGVLEAYQILKFTRRRAAKTVEKVLKSAVANTRTPGDEPNLYIAEAYIGQGPVLKRIRPRAMGRAAIYRRKTCHIHIVVESRKAFARG